jgi:hypothetical protein
MKEYYLEKLLHLILHDEIDYKAALINVTLDLPEESEKGFSREHLLKIMEGYKNEKQNVKSE